PGLEGEIAGNGERCTSRAAAGRQNAAVRNTGAAERAGATERAARVHGRAACGGEIAVDTQRAAIDIHGAGVRGGSGQAPDRAADLIEGGEVAILRGAAELRKVEARGAAAAELQRIVGASAHQAIDDG